MLFLLALALTAWTYRDSFASLIGKWSTDFTYSHGYLIFPICAWLTWRKRHELARTEARPSWLGVIALFAVVITWTVAKVTDVLVVEELAAVALVPGLVLAILGRDAFRVLLFPLAFLFFAVPFGRWLVPWLLQVTADIATFGLKVTGIPVFRSDLYIEIPAGTFEVATACAGLNYLITGVVLGVLYAYLTYQRWWKRALFIVASVLLPIFANGVRVYVTIAVSHLTDMRFGPGGEHIMFGRIFFYAFIFLMFWIGRRWRDEPAVTPRGDLHPAGDPLTGGGSVHAAAVWVTALLALVAGPAYFGHYQRVASEFTDAQVEAWTSLPTGINGWTGLVAEPKVWRPPFSGMAGEASAAFTRGAAARVDVWIGAYAVGSASGAEMISYNNRLYGTGGSTVFTEQTREVALGDGRTFEVREIPVTDGGNERLIWYWYEVGGRPTLNTLMVKWLEGLAFISNKHTLERVVAISSDGGSLEDRRQHLDDFLRAHAGCLIDREIEAGCRG